MKVKREPRNQLQWSSSLSCGATPAALVQHVKVELALADVAAIVVETVLEGLGMVATRISVHHRSSGSSSSRLRDNSLMLNSTGAHYSINSSVCHGTASTKCHTLSNCGPNSSKDGATTTLSRSWRRSLARCKKEFSAATLGTGMQYKLKQWFQRKLKWN